MLIGNILGHPRLKVEQLITKGDGVCSSRRPLGRGNMERQAEVSEKCYAGTTCEGKTEHCILYTIYYCI